MSQMKMWAIMFLATLGLGAMFGVQEKIKAGPSALDIAANMIQGEKVLASKAPAGKIDKGNADPETAEQAGMILDYSGDRPVVKEVRPGSLAEITGLKVGDIIDGVNHVVIHNKSRLEEELQRAHEDHSKVQLFVRRPGEGLPTLVLGEAPKVVKPAAPAAPVVGIQLYDMTGMVPSQINGWAPMIMGVEPGSLAERVGLKQSDWVVAVNGTRAKSMGQARELLAADGPLKIEYWREHVGLATVQIR